MEITKAPRRIISLVPSQTELLINLGVNVVGRTKFCIHPANKVKNIPIIGGTKKFRFEKISGLQPDLIIGNKEENYEAGIAQLKSEYLVWMSDIFSIKDALEMIHQVSDICQKREKGEELVRNVKDSLAQIKGQFSGNVLYLIWREPWMAVGRQTFVHDLLEHLGFENVINDLRYPELTQTQITELNPDYIFLSSEPFPFKNKHLEEIQMEWPSANCHLVDGEMFSWYGSRLLKIQEYFMNLKMELS